MARPTRYRSPEHHEVVASNVLDRHRAATGQEITMPVPVAQIIESTYNIEILYDTIEEPAGTMILGALFPAEKRIVINVAHDDLLGRVIGPERFTLAHELGHWLYDADDPGQQTLDFDSPQEQFCYDRKADHLTEQQRFREIGANKFAAALLLPARLLKGVDLDEVIAQPSRHAATWGVSRETLSYRLKDLGLLDDHDQEQLGL